MRFLAFFKNPLFLSILGITALCLAVWFGGAYIAFGNPPTPLSAMARLVIIMILLVLWGLNNLRIQMKQKNQSDNLIEDINKESAQVAPDNSASAEESAALQARFNEALSTIKTLRFGEKGKKRTVYELPWYLVIGPPGAGKTTLLANSGLQFPLKEKFGLKGIGGVGGTRNCDWWFTNEAVMIDTAGRYTTQDSDAEVDRSAWQNFLKLLKKHRPRRAINGVVVAISISELLMLSRTERTQHADTIRSRIQELVSYFEIEFPVYFMITKCDLIAGFTEYFEDLGQTDREQVWGITFPYEEQAANRNYADYFSSEFLALAKRLNDRLIWRMHHERDTKRLAKIENFPVQFEQLKDVLDAFVQEIFAENRYQKPPALRGVYFTSGTQEGSPIDRVLSSLSSHYGINVQSLAAPPGQGKSFFINRLLREIMFPEAGIVGLNRGFERKLKVIRAISISLMAVFTLATIGVWASSLIQNKRLMSEVTEKISEHETAVQASFGSNYDMEKVDAVLKPLDEATQIYTELSAPWLSSLGMYDGSVPESATKAYYSGLQQYYIPALAYRLQTILTTTKDDEELYNALRVYLMLGDKSRLEPEALTRWFSDDWLQEYQGKAALQGELKGFLADALTHGYQPINYNTVVLEQARNKAREVPIERRIYNQIRNHPEYSRLIDLELEVGRSLKAAFNDTSNGSRLKVPFLFTKAGYDKLDLSKDSDLVRKFASEQWVVGTETTEDFTDKDIENIAEKVKKLYLAEYTETWKSALTTLRVKSFANMNDARTILKTLTSTTDSPLVRFLNIASNQTSLTPRLAQLASKSNAANSNSAAIGGAVAALQENALPPTQVDKEFSKLHDLIDTNALENVVRKLESLSELLEGFALSPSQQAAAFDFAKGRFQGAGDDPIRGLLVESNQSPNPLKGWLGAIADESWKVVLGNSKAHLNQAWNSRVYQPFKASLGSRYPFSGASGDVALADFTEFFKPGGIEESFIKEFLTPFISTSKNWSPKSLNGRSIGISGAALTQIKRADTIRKVFFRKDASAASVDFTLTPTRMDSSVRRFELRFGETRVRYSHGPKLPVSLSWPGEGDNSIRLLFEDINETLRDANYTGDWALFKVLDSATVKKANQANTFFATFDVEGRKVDYQIKANSFLNPFQSSWMRLYSCPTSL